MKFLIPDFFHRNKTKVNVNVTHNNNSTSAVGHVTIILQASFKAEFSSVNLTSFSVIPDVLQNNRVEVRFLSCSHFYSVNHLISRKYWKKGIITQTNITESRQWTFPKLNRVCLVSSHPCLISLCIVLSSITVLQNN